MFEFVADIPMDQKVSVVHVIVPNMWQDIARSNVHVPSSACDMEPF